MTAHHDISHGLSRKREGERRLPIREWLVERLVEWRSENIPRYILGAPNDVMRTDTHERAVRLADRILLEIEERRREADTE